MLTPAEISADPAFDRPWYYSIELAQGLHTEGKGHQNVALTRKLIGHVPVEAGRPGGGQLRCIDLGTREALVPILLERRGATVLAYDRELLSDRLDLVSRSLGTSFETLGDFRMADLPAALAERGDGPFDLVVLSGVLYHMLDPLAGLAVARGLVRNGGLMIVETLAAFDEGPTMHFNTAGRFTPHALWLVSVPALDYLLRMLRLEALEAVHLDIGEKEGGPPFGRFAVACRAVDSPVHEESDERIAGDSPGDDLNFAEVLDWARVESEEPAIEYSAPEEAQVRRRGRGIDLLATARATAPYHVRPEQVRLDLDARH